MSACQIKKGRMKRKVWNEVGGLWNEEASMKRRKSHSIKFYKLDYEENTSNQYILFWFLIRQTIKPDINPLITPDCLGVIKVCTVSIFYSLHFHPRTSKEVFKWHRPKEIYWVLKAKPHCTTNPCELNILRIFLYIFWVPPGYNSRVHFRNNKIETKPGYRIKAFLHGNTQCIMSFSE